MTMTTTLGAVQIHTRLEGLTFQTLRTDNGQTLKIPSLDWCSAINEHHRQVKAYGGRVPFCLEVLKDDPHCLVTGRKGGGEVDIRLSWAWVDSDGEPLVQRIGLPPHGECWATWVVQWPEEGEARLVPLVLDRHALGSVQHLLEVFLGADHDLMFRRDRRDQTSFSPRAENMLCRSDIQVLDYPWHPWGKGPDFVGERLSDTKPLFAYDEESRIARRQFPTKAGELSAEVEHFLYDKDEGLHDLEGAPFCVRRAALAWAYSNGSKEHLPFGHWGQDFRPTLVQYAGDWYTAGAWPMWYTTATPEAVKLLKEQANKIWTSGLDDGGKNMSVVLDDKIAEAEAELERLRAEKAQSENWKPKVWTPEEKIQAFDRLHAFALAHLREVQAEGYANEDTVQWGFEAVMELLGPDVWEEYNRCLTM